MFDQRVEAPGPADVTLELPGALRAPLWVLCQVEGPRALTGDVDPNGDVVDALRPTEILRWRRLRDAVGPWLAADVDADEHLASVVRALKAVGAW